MGGRWVQGATWRNIDKVPFSYWMLMLLGATMYFIWGNHPKITISNLYVMSSQFLCVWHEPRLFALSQRGTAYGLSHVMMFGGEPGVYPWYDLFSFIFRIFHGAKLGSVTHPARLTWIQTASSYLRILLGLNLLPPNPDFAYSRFWVLIVLAHLIWLCHIGLPTLQSWSELI